MGVRQRSAPASTPPSRRARAARDSAHSWASASDLTPAGAGGPDHPARRDRRTAQGGRPAEVAAERGRGPGRPGRADAAAEPPRLPARARPGDGLHPALRRAGQPDLFRPGRASRRSTTASATPPATSALQAVAQRLRATCANPTSSAAGRRRIRGDPGPGRPSAAAMAKAAALARAVERGPVAVRRMADPAEDQLRRPPDHPGSSPEQVLADADAAMYARKRAAERPQRPAKAVGRID